MLTLQVGAVGLFSKAFLRFGCSEVNVHGLPTLLDALEEGNRNGRGLITVSNHISVVDDPFSWGILPWRLFFSSRTTRWTLGASDIMFTNPVFSEFFRRGQVIETFRGQGIHQKAVDIAIQKLDEGEWIHIFPEGRVNQVRPHPERGLLRFKWGTAHMILQAKQTPRIIPMYLEGFDDVMPEDRGFPRFIPRIGKKIRITFGDPQGITHEIDFKLNEWQRLAEQGLPQPSEAERRISISESLQNAVKNLGDAVTRP